MASTQIDMETLRALNKRFIHNFVTNDVPSHNAILHPLFRTINTTGSHMDRVALVGATNKWTRVRDGVEAHGMTCYTDTYIRTGENWLCILAQLTSVAPQNYPPDDTIVVKYLRGVLQ